MLVGPLGDAPEGIGAGAELVGHHRLAVEQGGSMGWDRYVGHDGGTITMKTFGASAPLANLQEKFGFTVDNICAVARDLIEKNK